jgi:hypothetical protein
VFLIHLREDSTPDLITKFGFKLVLLGTVEIFEQFRKLGDGDG